MGKLFDEKPIPFYDEAVINEAYVDYGRNDLHEMTKKELQEELKRVQTDINKLKEELENASNCPTYSIKSQIKTAEVYTNKIKKQLTNFDVKTESAVAVSPVKPIGGIDGMISDLKKKLDKGIITKAYYNEYVTKLENRRKDYEAKVKADLEKQRKEKELEEKKKNHPFRKFKTRLTDYATKR